ncbi:penicillin-binding transpeptidase domain-containing protein [Streptomyces sp. NPDC060194]|uniref:penicillin-binding transpeptidase domain-containing protein n=1 Tax=Streptomyces sp. NPDC060194 TaxID=3347069 RepID=UPI0036688B5C
MRNGAKAAVVGGALSILLGGAGYGMFNIYTALDGGGGSGGGDGDSTVQAAATRKGSGPVTGDEVAAVSKAFFAAWAKGEVEVAAALTDNGASATAGLDAYFGDAHLTDVRITPGKASGTTVPFTVAAKVSYDGVTKPLKYASEASFVRGVTTGRALVDWKPAVLHPDLGANDVLTTGEADAPDVRAVDRNGAVLDAKDHPSLAPVLAELRKRYGAKAGGTNGIELAVHDTVDAERPDRTLVTLRKGRAGELRTTLSANVQTAAEKAVKRFPQASVVALDVNTGGVLAVANNRDDEFNAAFEGQVAPGSVMKIVSAAMLIDTGQTSAQGPAPCPMTAVSEGQTFANLKGLDPNDDSTLAEGFSRSCNTSFIKFADTIGADSLTTEADRYFGLGRDDWSTGIPSFDGSVPVTPGPDTAAALIGQGKVQMSPLNIASVAATVKSGGFRQPVIVPKSLDGRDVASRQQLKWSTAQQLRDMMRRTAVSGTGQQVMSGLGGDVGAKTGSAEVATSATSDSWFVGYRNSVSAAALVQDGGHGSDAAGPIVADVLRAGS